MAQEVMHVTSLPDDPLAAAEAFLHAVKDVPATADLVVILPAASHEHAGWRLAAVQDMARRLAPAHRCNAVVGNHQPGIDRVIAWLADAPGVTGQVFELDGENG